jgi:hypothetical protein
MINEPDSLSMTATYENESCLNNSDGTINLTISGGIPPYQYNWAVRRKTLLTLLTFRLAIIPLRQRFEQLHHNGHHTYYYRIAYSCWF